MNTIEMSNQFLHSHFAINYSLFYVFICIMEFKVRKLKFIVKIKLFTYDHGAESKNVIFELLKNALTFLLNDQSAII